MKFQKRKILVVDDDKAFLDLIQGYFSSHEYDVICAADTSKALSSMREGRYKVVLLDYQMPLVNGDDLIAMLQQINPSVRVIVLSGMIAEEVEEKFKGLGYYAYFEKGQLPLKQLEEAVLKAFDA